MREAEERLAREAPQKLEAFQFYVESLFSYLQPRWRSPADANAPWTDDQFAVKHTFQNKLFGPKEEEGWEGWNHYFLERITVTAKDNPGSRVVVLVGVEHCYWLRAPAECARNHSARHREPAPLNFPQNEGLGPSLWCRWSVGSGSAKIAGFEKGGI